MFVWVKLRPNAHIEPFVVSDLHAGLGHYTRANCEVALLGRIGNVLPRRSRTVRQVVLTPVGRHSAKPPEVRTRLLELFGNVPRIELVAREQVTGWDSWGNEVGNGA